MRRKERLAVGHDAMDWVCVAWRRHYIWPRGARSPHEIKKRLARHRRRELRQQYRRERWA